MFCATLFDMLWRIILLGKISAVCGEKTLVHFESSRAVALLARLALFPNRTHPREELAELLWPEVEPEIGRRRLRHVLGTLRVSLEAGLPPGSVLIANKNTVRINPGAITTDVAELERTKDRRLYTGELLPGLYDDWIVEERHRLEALAESLAPAVAKPSSGEVRADREEGRRGTSRGDGIALPPYLTVFFGREAEQESIASQLMRSRLVTLTGLGGTGKTRLSVEILRSLAPKFPQAAFVALGECLVASQIPGRVRDALGLPAVSADPLEQVAWALSDAPSLLVLDNFEQLVDSGGAELAEVLLARLPQLTLLVTSRRALSIPGERLFPLEALPPADAVALFLDRVQASRPSFHLTAGNQEDIGAVCQGLEGIPLALELAAARIRAFSPSEMRSELQSRFEWLARTGLRGDKEDRHRSLSAALDWSWRLLPGSQQRFLTKLSLFRAPFTAVEAARVTGFPDARERLEGLVSDSLVQSAADGDSGKTRYTLLETVREFALVRLEEPEVARASFRKHYLDTLTGRLDFNAASAWEYALDDASGEDASAFAARYEADWTGLLGVARVRGLLERTRTLSCTDPLQRLLTAHHLAECLAREADRKGAMGIMAEVVSSLEELGGEVLAEGLRLQAFICQYEVPNEVTHSLLDRCLGLTKEARRRADALRLKGCRFLWTANFEEAQPFFDEAEPLYPPKDRARRFLLDHRAQLAYRRGQYEQCLRLNRLATELALAAGDSALARNCQANLPQILGHLGRDEEAIAQSLECLDTEEAHGDRFQLLGILWNLAFPLLKVGEGECAARLMAATAALWVREVRPLDEEDIGALNAFRTELVTMLGEARLAQLWAEGEVLTLKGAIALVRTRRLEHPEPLRS
jgi:predicted ATPase